MWAELSLMFTTTKLFIVFSKSLTLFKVTAMFDLDILYVANMTRDSLLDPVRQS